MITTKKVAQRIAGDFYDAGTVAPELFAALIDAVDKALQAEREQAAIIAETYLSDYRNNLSPSSVAAAIREGKIKHDKD